MLSTYHVLSSMLGFKKACPLTPKRKPAKNIQRHLGTSESQTSQSVNTDNVPKNSELKQTFIESTKFLSYQYC